MNDENVATFRDCYQKLSKVSKFDDHEIDETALYNTAKELGIKIDSDNDRVLLKNCVRYDDIEQTLECMDILIQGPVQPLSSSLPVVQPPLSSDNVSISLSEPFQEEKPPTNLMEIKCIVIVKYRGKYVDDFIQKFLLKVVNETSTNEPTINDRSASYYTNQFLLHSRSLLALFIHEQVRSLGIIRRRQLKRLRLVEPLSIIDEFGAWSYDHLRDLFEIELRAHRDEFFPSPWILAEDARIHCQFIFSGTQQANETSTSLILERPRTSSLEQFVRDVCSKEDNMQTDKWLAALHAEDILSFAHLSNLKQSEWDNIKRLSMNAKRILKAAVDRERESAADDRRRLFEESSPDQELLKSIDKPTAECHSELFASLHLIKLFIYYTLRFERALQNNSSLPKLEAACIDASFSEMRKEGYADDGLFSTMGEFFLPLTISEQELRMKRSHTHKKVKVGKLEELGRELHRLEHLWTNATSSRWEVDDNINELHHTMNEMYTGHIAERARLSTASTSREQAKELQQLDRQWQDASSQFEQQMLVYKQAVDKWINDIAGYEKQIEELKAQIRNIQTELKQPEFPVDKGLVKPARGFIMYGPPGTGKSEIMSKLSVKLGICMVGPPLAAGELNRPLVGESERVIIALASRCHRVPYAMCCLSIDEIDSLAPKRDEDSSEGKVDKISVLLSLIDGIKDVPNLMIFCATNRLHMMDEAFLRRMSGKFFVGRPSSQARMRILAQIPEWALESDLIDRLAIASTNFSGAACKAFTRAITVRCMAVQRTNPDFHVNYHEALKIADRTAQQYQVFLGSETLPRLLLRNLTKRSEIRVNHLTRHMYAGRIIVDLHGSRARIETILTDGRITVIEHKLNPTETSVQSLLERLTVYGKDRNVQLLQLIDLNLLASQGAYDEKKVFETLKERYDECVAYSRSMIIYDLDALVGVNKSESDSSMGRSMSSSVVNQSVYTYVRARFREAVVEQSDNENNEQQKTVEKWAVAVIREPFLLRQFSSDVQFARTRDEEEEAELERRKAEDLLKCVKCKDLYIENENKMGNCVHHDGFIFDNSAPDLAVYTQSEVAYALSKLESDIINYPDRREEYERQKNKYKWICCDTTVTTGSGAGGCKKGKHSCGEQIGEERRRDRSHLDQTRIKRWEEECRRNQEYNEKWLLLLENRS
ncbi:unnamed protein product [Adineta steineri]|uniref:AAA+ ATPase domain-containing protein n=1 Tax=Adineta steineri TaxID=433720 RepID=A0A819ACF8_9BILA|nr:unnamed protein product [Adineta steineri]CAF3782186.1 unnamed protein product [Adineta steineri]